LSWESSTDMPFCVPLLSLVILYCKLEIIAEELMRDAALTVTVTWHGIFILAKYPKVYAFNAFYALGFYFP